jgi:hypothetical protein
MVFSNPLEHMQLGWWSGISGNLSDPYGLIIRISAEHGRYVARSYDTRYYSASGRAAYVSAFVLMAGSFILISFYYFIDA